METGWGLLSHWWVQESQKAPPLLRTFVIVLPGALIRTQHCSLNTSGIAEWWHTIGLRNSTVQLTNKAQNVTYILLRCWGIFSLSSAFCNFFRTPLLLGETSYSSPCVLSAWAATDAVRQEPFMPSPVFCSMWSINANWIHFRKAAKGLANCSSSHT